MRNFNFKMPAIFRGWIEGKMKTQLSRYARQACIFIFLMSSAKLFAQSVVTGTVTDENKEALIGVNVSVKGSSSGAMTDVDGKYSLSVPNADAVLVFSFVGFDKQEIPVRNQTRIDVVLKASESVLSEVVVVGYGTQVKANLTGAVSTISRSSRG